MTFLHDIEIQFLTIVGHRLEDSASMSVGQAVSDLTAVPYQARYG